MANPLTGDFQAVLQVSGATVNRLLASMHQNAGVQADKPSFPHSVRLRVGDPHPIHGMRGTIAAQVSVPTVELIHGVDDRFYLDVGIRAQYKADPGTTPIPEFIHGTVRAMYRLDGIDASCWGWGKHAAEYLWIRVVGDSVAFTGTAFDVTDVMSIVPPIADAVADARITQLVTALLKTRFEATPHKVSARFRRGAMRSLHVGLNRTVVAAPLGLSGDPGPGRLDSINQDILDGRDFGVAINRDVILAKIQSSLDDLKNSFNTVISVHHRTYVDLGFLGDVDVVEVNISWRVTLTNAQAQWWGGSFPFFTVSGGVIAITLAGQARTQKSGFDWDFDVTQYVLLTFDAGLERFTASAMGSAIVGVHGPFGAVVEPYAKPEIQKQVAGAVQSALVQLGNELTLKNRKDELVNQLQTIDGAADAHFDEAVFSLDGVIVRGHIGLSPRRAPVGRFGKTPEQDGFTAFDSWIPGGRIDAFDWSWSWFNNSGDPGSQSDQDPFILRRPRGSGMGRFGAMIGLKRPLPGLDGGGRMCLNVRGEQVHPVTGAFVPASTGKHCERFGIDLRVGLNVGDRVFIKEWAPTRDPSGPVQEIAVHELGTSNGPGARVNTLVVFAGERWTPETAAALRDGLAASQRRDAGLFVIILFADGALTRSGQAMAAELREFASELEAPLLVNEDVGSTWSEALLGSGGYEQLEWRLISPTGGMVWAHTGPATARDVAGALDDYLFPSAAADVHRVAPRFSPGSRLSSIAIEIGAYADADIENPCPPPPIGRVGTGSVIAFVRAGSTASESVMRRLAQEHGGQKGAPFVAALVDPANDGDVNRLGSVLHEDFVAIPDPGGALARRLGVRVWPTIVTVNDIGIVTRVDMGAEPAQPVRSEEAQ